MSVFRQPVSSFMKHHNLNFRYKGPLVTKEFPKPVSKEILNKALETYKAAAAKKIDQPSPFHVAFLYQKSGGRPWTEKVILRRLGKKSQQNRLIY